MNERIKQLAEQAGSTHKQSLGVYQFYSHELEKFAELIIRQCAYEADLFAAFGCPSNMNPEKTGVGDYIKNVFGVKE